MQGEELGIDVKMIGTYKKSSVRLATNGEAFCLIVVNPDYDRVLSPLEFKQKDGEMVDSPLKQRILDNPLEAFIDATRHARNASKALPELILSVEELERRGIEVVSKELDFRFGTNKLADSIYADGAESLNHRFENRAARHLASLINICNPESNRGTNDVLPTRRSEVRNARQLIESFAASSGISQFRPESRFVDLRSLLMLSLEMRLTCLLLSRHAEESGHFLNDATLQMDTIARTLSFERQSLDINMSCSIQGYSVTHLRTCSPGFNLLFKCEECQYAKKKEIMRMKGNYWKANQIKNYYCNEMGYRIGKKTYASCSQKRISRLALNELRTSALDNINARMLPEAFMGRWKLEARTEEEYALVEKREEATGRKASIWNLLAEMIGTQEIDICEHCGRITFTQRKKRGRVATTCSRICANRVREKKQARFAEKTKLLKREKKASAARREAKEKAKANDRSRERKLERKREIRKGIRHHERPEANIGVLKQTKKEVDLEFHLENLKNFLEDEFYTPMQKVDDDNYLKIEYGVTFAEFQQILSHIDEFNGKIIEEEAKRIKQEQWVSLTNLYSELRRLSPAQKAEEAASVQAGTEFTNQNGEQRGNVDQKKASTGKLVEKIGNNADERPGKDGVPVPLENDIVVKECFMPSSQDSAPTLPTKRIARNPEKEAVLSGPIALNAHAEKYDYQYKYCETWREGEGPYAQILVEGATLEFGFSAHHSTCVNTAQNDHGSYASNPEGSHSS